jgi:hypothetical protein
MLKLKFFVAFLAMSETIYQLTILLKLRLELEIKARACVPAHVRICQCVHSHTHADKIDCFIHIKNNNFIYNLLQLTIDIKAMIPGTLCRTSSDKLQCLLKIVFLQQNSFLVNFDHFQR